MFSNGTNFDLATLLEEKILETSGNQHLRINRYNPGTLCTRSIPLSETELVLKNTLPVSNFFFLPPYQLVLIIKGMV